MNKKDKDQLDMFNIPAEISKSEDVGIENSQPRIPAGDSIKRRFAYLYHLAERGATEGEKKAARKAMERLIVKYDIDNMNLDELHLQEYAFKYSSQLEHRLLVRLCIVIIEIDPHEHGVLRTWKEVDGNWIACREIILKLSDLDYITLECAYEYFRRHMNKEWKRTALPILKRCRKAKTRNKKREQLQVEFFQQYCIVSKLYKDGELKKREIASAAELKRALLFNGIEGGEFKQQVGNGLYLEEGK